MSDIEQRLREGIGRSGISGGICADDCDAANRLMDEAADTIAAWNRRAPQAVGPEPAVAVKWEQLSEIINAAVKVAIRTGSDFHIDADKLAEFAGSALVATPPAEPVVEALREYADPRNWVVNGRFDPHSGNFDGTSFAVTALATKPAVKDDETVVEALLNNITDVVAEAEVDFPAGRDAGARVSFDEDAVRGFIRAALAAKDGRS